MKLRYDCSLDVHFFMFYASIGDARFYKCRHCERIFLIDTLTMNFEEVEIDGVKAPFKTVKRKKK